ncbi:TolC family protein [Methylocystis bryophila]|uniref:Transporter n=1 Tax=Methylocystis bryophila TaxID=655015 RepID=A0A1W6MZH8_9HYPH|nr:TolC family protein [Methylocystis bryophila]ARN82963.1 transporter [Methylocystis bryophila]BDV39251.1 hypothetical protein DSM21852_25040 [Methylocystis bryophila]
MRSARFIRFFLMVAVVIGSDDASAKIKAKPSNARGLVIARHMDMAVDADAQSRALAAQVGAVSANYAKAASVTPGSPYVGGAQRNNVAGNLRGLYESEVEVGMPLWLPGQRDAFEATVSASVHETEEMLIRRRLEVAGLLREAWWTAQRAARLTEVARQRVATAQEIGANMKRRVELGDAAKTDALLADNETLAAETELAQAIGSEKVAYLNYAALTNGGTPTGSLEVLEPTRDMELHPELRALRAAVSRAETEAKLVERSPIDNPEVGVFMRQDHNYQYVTGADQPFQDQRTDSTTVGVHFRVPLPTDARNEPKRAAAEAELVKTQAEYERASRVILAQVQAARESLAAAQKAAVVAKKRLVLASEQFALSQKSFALGETSAFDLYRVRQLQLEAQKMEANARIDVGVAISRVNQALGYAP